MPPSRRTPDRPCLNCGDPTAGNYCPNCGQRKVEVRVSLRRMLMEALDDQFSLNSSLPRTLAALFFRPGHLTSEYMLGRIARYIPPFRLYLIGSLLFFVVLSFSVSRTVGTTDFGIDADSSGVEASRDSAGERRSWIGQVRANTGWTELDTLIVTRVGELGQMEPRDAIRRVSSQFLEYVPQTMFLLLPVFAALLKLLHIRRGRLYVEHFVFALHVHAFVFIVFAIQTLIGIEAIEGLVTLWMMAYMYLAMHRVYGQGWLMTGVKYVAFGFTYFLVLTVALVATLIAVLLLM